MKVLTREQLERVKQLAMAADALVSQAEVIIRNAHRSWRLRFNLRWAHASLAGTVCQCREFLDDSGGLCCRLDGCQLVGQALVGTFAHFLVRGVGQSADPGYQLCQFTAQGNDGTALEDLHVVGREDEPALRGGTVGNVEGCGRRLAVGICIEHGRVGRGFGMDDVIATERLTSDSGTAARTDVHPAAHEVQVVGTGGVGMIGRLEAGSVGHVIA